MADRGQSEVLGFVFVFAIVVTAIGVVTATGYAGLRDARDAQRLDNAEATFEILADNVEDLVRGGAPSRATEIDLADARLRFGDPVVVNVSGTAVSDPDRTFSYEYEARPIVYDAGTGTDLVYAAGAVVRDGPGGAAVLREPNLLLSGERTLVPIVQTRSQSPRSVGGSRHVRIRTRRAETTLLAAETVRYDVTLTLTTPRAGAWDRYLSGLSDVSCTHADGSDQVSCTLTTDRVYLTVVRIDVSFD